MNEHLETIAKWLADYYLLSSVLLALALAVLAMTRQPVRRRAVSQSAISGLILLGALCALPNWSTVSLLTPKPPADSHGDHFDFNGLPRAGDTVVGGQLQNPVTVSQPALPIAAPSPSAETPRDAIAPHHLTRSAILAVIWAGTSLSILSWLALGSFAALRMRSEASSAPRDLIDLMNCLAASNDRVPRDVELLISRRITVAVALGIWRPAILLPAKWVTKHSNPCREARGEPGQSALGKSLHASGNFVHTVLAHELAHIANRDLHWLAASRALLVALWAQPLFWLLRRRMRLDQEVLADAAAAEITSRQGYAEQLVAWARDVAARPAIRLSPAVGLWEGPSQLRERIALLIDERFTVLRSCTRRWQLSAITLCGALAVGLSLVTFEPAQTEAPQVKPQPAANSSTPEAESVTVVCVDRDGKPVAGAEVHLFQHRTGEKVRYVHFGPLNSDEKGLANFAKAITHDDGRFDRFIYARVPGRLVGVARSAKFTGRKVFNPNAQVVLQPSRSVEGQVTVPPGFDPKDVTVLVRTLHVINGPDELDYESFPRAVHFPGLDTALPEIFERRPDANGRIKFDDIPEAGRLYLMTQGKGLGEAQWWNGGDTFDKSFELRVEKEARLIGKVALPDGKPAGGMKVEARISSNGANYLSTFSAETNDMGQFVIDGLPRVAFTLSIQDPDEQWVFRPVQNLRIPRDGDELELDTFKLETGVKVSGTVSDPDGKPVEGASLSAVADNGERPGIDSDSTDAQGRYALRVPAGGVQLYFNSLPDGFRYPEPNIVKNLDIQSGQEPIENLAITVQRRSEADEIADREEAEGSQLLRDIRAATASILAAMAKDHGYGLEPGQDLRRVAPPFPPIRVEYYRTGHPSQSDAIEEGPSAMAFRWSNGKLRNWGMTFGGSTDDGYSLTGVLDALLDIKSQQIDGPSELLKTRLAGDWVIREGATQDAVIKQLQDILQKEFSLPVKLEFREVERPVYVVRGEYELTPLPGQEGKGKLILTDETITTDEIQIFGTDLVPNSGAGGGTGEFEEFLAWLGRWIGTPIVSEVDLKPTNQVSWHLHERSPSTEQTRSEDHDPILVLGNITLQTGLTFSLEKRPVRILFVERTQ